MSVVEIYPPERMESDDGLLAIIVRPERSNPGAHFITEPYLNQQVAVTSYPSGYIVKPHTHPNIDRRLCRGGETIVLTKGILSVDIYTSIGQWVTNWLLRAGDVLVLVAGGHGFVAMTDVELIEIKVGPHVGISDKVYFDEGERSGSL